MERIVAAYFQARDGLEPIAAKELLARLRKGDVVILDVRPEDEYGLGHLPGDADALRDEVRKKYREVATDPHGSYHFHTGRPLAARLGYEAAIR